MRLWIAFYRNPPRLVNKEGTDTYRGFRITDTDIIHGAFGTRRREVRSRDLTEGRGRLKITPELEEYFRIAHAQIL